MIALRKIEPMLMPAGIVTSAELGALPSLRWVNPTDLHVDATYQRDLSKRSVELIRGMVKGFAWNRMKPPIVVESDGLLHVLDGQHTAIAAATLRLGQIPVFIVDAPSLDQRARAFVGHNTDRITVSPVAIHRALVASGDPDALDVAAVCKRAGVRIRQLNQSVLPAEGDTMAIGTIRDLVKRRGVNARKVLEVLVKARRAPLAQEEIKAAELLVCEGKADLETLTAVVRIEGDAGLLAARAKAKAERSPIWRAVADRWSVRLQRRAQ